MLSDQQNASLAGNEIKILIEDMELKNRIEKKTGIEPKNQRLYFQNKELNRNNSYLSSYCITENGSIIHLHMKTHNEGIGSIKPLSTMEECIPDSLKTTIKDIHKAFLEGLVPKLTDDGTSGTYFLHNLQRKSIAIFKPHDEEPFTPNNPRGYLGTFNSEGFRKGILSGESACREAAAYLLDKEYSFFHDVPPTTLVELWHKHFQKLTLKSSSKKGSLQSFIDHDDVAGNWSCSVFPVDQVHKIAILDVRILNCDRNEENILVKKKKIKNGQSFFLIPIDHGLSFPDTFSTCEYEIVWMDWPQVKEPFSMQTLEYIAKIDPIHDIKLLTSKISFRKECLQKFCLAEIFLKKAAQKGLTLYEIGKIIYKEDEDQNAEIVEIIQKTERICHLLNSRIGDNIMLDKLLKIWRKKNQESVQINMIKKNVELILQKKSSEHPIIEDEEEEDEKVMKIDKETNYSSKENSVINKGQKEPSSSKKLTNYPQNSLDLNDELEEKIPLQRSFSLPSLNREDSNDKKKEKKLVRFNKLKKVSKNRIVGLHSLDQIFEEKFLYYFESFVDQFLEIKFQNKNKAKNKFRNRIFSSDSDDKPNK